MAYEKHTWQTGEIVTAEKLNRNEKQLSDVSREVENARGSYLDLSEHLEAVDRASSQISNDMGEILNSLS